MFLPMVYYAFTSMYNILIFPVTLQQNFKHKPNN